ncbi:unnamed protein product [Symbiodinium natans]|uniref:Uncharacterized protein n=1 Tax=Symbiodinium natans TaxID=878477 RepID=A0A812I897_9DINO|nr:unnamed protein product [Symbiodinium natans]
MPQHWSVSIATQLAFLFVYPDIRDGPPKALDEFSLEEDTSHEKDATLQILEHNLSVLSAHSLKDFLLPDADVQRLMQSMDPTYFKKLEWPPVEERALLRFVPCHKEVADEESRQWRAFNLIYSTLHGRGLAVAELCHPLWNDFKRSLGKARMMSTLLKATHTVNHGAGPWRSGKRRLGIHAAAKRLMDLAEYAPEYMANLTERVNWDRGWQGGGGPLTREEVLKSRAAKRRLPYAKNKSWFGILDSFAALDYDWSILEDVLAMCNGNHSLQQVPDDDVCEEEEDDDDDEAEDEQGDGGNGPAARATVVAEVEDFMHDHSHHVRVRVLILVGRVLQTEYTAALDAHKEGLQKQLEWQAWRSYGKWFETVVRMFELFESRDVFKALDLRERQPDAEAVPVQDNQNEVAACQHLLRLVAQVASARCWSQLHHTLALPHCLAQVFLPRHDLLLEVQEFFEKISQQLHLLNEALQPRPDVPKSRRQLVAELVDDLGTMDWVLTREILMDGAKHEWDLCSQGMRNLAFSAFGSSAETKSTCENAFSWLADAVARQSKANKFHVATKMLYLLSCPYAGAGGCNPIRPLPEDVRLQTAEDNNAFQDLGAFAAKFYKLPLEGVTPHNIKKWRPAGYLSQRHSAAAHAFVLQFVDERRGVNFAALENVWSGCLLVLGQVYQERATRKYILSLGFMKYVTLAVVLQPLVCEVYLRLRSDETAAEALPTFVWNSSPGRDSDYVHIECQIVPPASCEAGNLICLKRTSMTSNGLLKSALLNGVQLTKAQVEKCMAAEQIPFPQHRPRGRLLKADLVDALLSNVLDGESEETIAQVRKRLCRETQPDAEEDDDDELCPEEILRLIRNMDQDNREHFKEVQKEMAVPVILAQENQSPAKRQKNLATMRHQPPARKDKNLTAMKNQNLALIAQQQKMRKEKRTCRLSLMSGATHPVAAQRGHCTPPGVQRTKQQSWSPGIVGQELVNQQVQSLDVVFSFVERTYHRHFDKSTNYDKDWKRTVRVTNEIIR